MVNEEKINPIDEIIDYLASIDNCSYYDLFTYACDNDKHTWVKALDNSKNKQFISAFLESKKRATKSVYKDKRYQAMLNYMNARKKYEERKNNLN